MNKTMKSILTASIAGVLTACGGGGGGDSGSKIVLSITQQNFETTAIADYFASFDSNLPATNVAPTPGTHFFRYESNSAPSSPYTGPVVNTRSVSNMSSKLALPEDASKYNVERVLIDGKIYSRNATSKQEWSYVGNDVLLTSYADDGKTKLYTAVYDEWSAPKPFSETIKTANILNSFFDFKRLNTSSTLDFAQKWIGGSSYFTRKGYQLADTLYVWDWPGSKTTYNASVSYNPGTETKFKELFSANAGGIDQDGDVYKFEDGTLKYIQDEISAWVANEKRPPNASATDGYFVIFQLDGKFYQGMLRKAGVRFQFVDGVNTSIINDYDIRLNSNAVESLKQTVKF